MLLSCFIIRSELGRAWGEWRPHPPTPTPKKNEKNFKHRVYPASWLFGTT